MLPSSYRIARMQKTLRWFEADIPLLNMRVKDLSLESQKSVRQFADALVSQTRSELQRLLEEDQDDPGREPADEPCEPAD
jgi:hypothetical protein